MKRALTRSVGFCPVDLIAVPLMPKSKRVTKPQTLHFKVATAKSISYRIIKGKWSLWLGSLKHLPEAEPLNVIRCVPAELKKASLLSFWATVSFQFRPEKKVQD